METYCEASQLQPWMVSVHELLFAWPKQARVCLEFLKSKKTNNLKTKKTKILKMKNLNNNNWQ